jgi:formylglycine-generating enzyme required for sulfatase activity
MNLRQFTALIGSRSAILRLLLAAVLAFSSMKLKASNEEASAATIMHPKDNAEMILIPAGSFKMGCDSGWQIEGPEHAVDLPAFYMDRFEVSIDQFRRFVDSGAYQDMKYWKSEQARMMIERFGDHPFEWDEILKLDGRTAMCNVSFYEASAYCQWAGKELPTAAQWEKAARGSDGRKYPWGVAWIPENASAASVQSFDGGNAIFSPWPGLATGHPEGRSIYGIEQMSGNVWEWTKDEFKPYPGNEKPHLFYPPLIREMRGGSWNLDPKFATTTFRNFNEEMSRNRAFGFRCVCEEKP